MTYVADRVAGWRRTRFGWAVQSVVWSAFGGAMALTGTWPLAVVYVALVAFCVYHVVDSHRRMVAWRDTGEPLP